MDVIFRYKEATEMEKMITITKAEYDKLLDSQKILEALEGVGVDNWGGYNDTIELYDEDED